MNEHLPVQRHLRDLELCLLQPSVRKSTRVAELLAEDFVEFGSSGRTFNKDQTICSLRDESPAECTATQLRVQLLAPQIALITYRAHRHTEPPVDTLRSSLWALRQGQWQMVFHQGTLSSFL